MVKNNKRKTINKIAAKVGSIVAKQRPAPRTVVAKQGSFLKYIPRGILGAAGFLSGGVPSAVKGWEAGASMSRALGLGRYGISQRSVSSTVSQVPAMHSGQDFIRVTNREYIGDVLGSSNFNNTSFTVNPGLSAMFPWLSGVARNFQQYRVEGMMVHYRATSSFTNPSGASVGLGTVMMTANYNSTDPAFNTKAEVQANVWTVSGPPCSDAEFYFECAPKLTSVSNLYVRSGSLVSGLDPRFTDFCTFQVSTEGTESAAHLGELWVSYDVILMKPIFQSVRSDPEGYAHFRMTDNATDNVPYSAPFNIDTSGNTMAAVVNTIGAQLTYNTIHFPPGTAGRYWITYTDNTPAPTECKATSASFANCSAISGFFQNPSGLSANVSTAPEAKIESLRRSVDLAIVITDPTISASVTFTSLGGVVHYSADLFVLPISSSLAKPVRSAARSGGPAVLHCPSVFVDPSPKTDRPTDFDDDEKSVVDIMPASAAGAAAAGAMAAAMATSLPQTLPRRKPGERA